MKENVFLLWIIGKPPRATDPVELKSTALVITHMLIHISELELVPELGTGLSNCQLKLNIPKLAHVISPTPHHLSPTLPVG